MFHLLMGLEADSIIYVNISKEKKHGDIRVAPVFISRVNTPQLSDRNRLLLAEGLKNGESHCFGSRCHVILLKAEGCDSGYSETKRYNGCPKIT
jgi:hypothetical protein